MASETILVIEDNAANRLLAEAILQTAGYQVLFAGDAELGISLARSEQPALILMDISLPGMDGLAATARLRGDAATRSIPVVALTAHAMQGDQERALSAGCVAYVSKPFDRPELLQIVAGAIGPRRGEP